MLIPYYIIIDSILDRILYLTDIFLYVMDICNRACSRGKIHSATYVSLAALSAPRFVHGLDFSRDWKNNFSNPLTRTNRFTSQEQNTNILKKKFRLGKTPLKYSFLTCFVSL